MRLHTSLTYEQVEAALRRAKDKGHVSESIQFTDTNQPGRQSFRNMAVYGSRSHERSFEVQLSASYYAPIPEPVNMHGREQKTRRRSMSGQAWAASYREWGWFMAEVLDADHDALFGNMKSASMPNGWGYNGLDDFNEKTKYEFDLY